MPLMRPKRPVSAVNLTTGGEQSALANALDSLRQGKEEQTEKVINARDQREQEIMDILGGIDFVNSAMPKDALIPKPGHRFPPIVQDIDRLKKLVRSKEEFPVDTKALDEKLKKLAEKLKFAIESGELTAVEASMNGMFKCLTEVRRRISKVSKDAAVSFTKKGVEYAESWIRLTDLCSECDQLKRQIPEMENQARKLEKQKDELFEMIKKKIDDKPEYRQAMNDMVERIEAVTDMEREVRSDFTDRKLIVARHELSAFALDQQMLFIKNKEYQARTMYDAIFRAPIASSEMNEQAFREAIDTMFVNFSKMDEELKRTDLTLTEIASRMKDLQNSEGNVAATNAAVESANEFMEELRKKQDNEVKAKGISAKDFYSTWGVRSAEEQAAAIEEEKAKNEYMNSIREEYPVEDDVPVYEEAYEEESDELYI